MIPTETSSAPGSSHRILLIDASPYIFRSYFALPSSIRTPDGSPANATNGFASFLIKLLTEEQPTHVAVAFDGSLTTSFRNEIFPEYKANRDPPPAELVQQLVFCRQVASALGLLTDISDRFEADDLIGSWLTQVSWGAPPASISIVSSDKDLGQLVAPAVDLYDFAKGNRMDSAAIQAKFGVPPSKIVDYLALAGDAVDNIPGVAGVGPKTAAQLLERFDGVIDVLTNFQAVADSGLRGAAGLSRKLSLNADTARLSLELARLATDASVETQLTAFAWTGPSNQWPRLCEQLGFTSLLQRGLALKGNSRAQSSPSSTS